MIFYDQLVILTSLDKKIKKIAGSSEEKQELWQMVEEIIHHKVLGCCLTYLPQENHHEFLEMFHKAPHNQKLFEYLDQKTKKDMKKEIKEEIKKLTKDLLLLSSNKV